MPELPEVEASRALISRHCKGRRVLEVIAADDDKVFDGSQSQDVVSALQGRTLVDVHRKGKQMWLSLAGDKPQLLMHFGMTGYIAVKEATEGSIHVLAYENAPHDSATWPPRFHKLLLRLGARPGEPAGSTCEFAYCDARRFGRVKLCEGDPADSEVIKKLGFDPLLEMPDLQAFKELLSARAKAATRLKPLLLDQGFCAGVGNWVADEVLWQARLHPEQLVANMHDNHVAALHEALQEVVRVAVAADADSAKFPTDWMFHVRWGKKAGTLLGHKLDHITVGSRTSCYVPALQKLVGRSDPPQTTKTKQAPGKQQKRKKNKSADDGPAEDTKLQDAGATSSAAVKASAPAGLKLPHKRRKSRS